MLYNQIHFDMMLETKDYRDFHYTLDSSENLVKEIRRGCESLSSEHKKQLEEFINFWVSHFERYRAIVFALEKEYAGAVINIFKAINSNPNYPYYNYSDLKVHYPKRYAIELVPYLIEHQQDFKLDITPEENIAVMNELIAQIPHQDITYHHYVLADIMVHTTDHSDIISLIEEELEKLRNDSVFSLIAKSEIVRRLKKGRRKINGIYAARIDSAIDYLKQASNIDKDFPVLQTKIASLLLQKGSHGINYKSIWDAVVIYKKSLHFLVQLGFRMGPKQ